MNILVWLILIPVLGAVASFGRIISGKWAARGAAILNLAICLFAFFTYQNHSDATSFHAGANASSIGIYNSDPIFSYVWSFPVVPILDLKFLVGVDGLSMVMVLGNTRHGRRRLDSVVHTKRRIGFLWLPIVNFCGCHRCVCLSRRLLLVCLS